MIKDGPVLEGSDQAMHDFAPELPLGWMLAAEAPSQIKLTGDVTKIVIKHAKVRVSAASPKSNSEVLPHNPMLNYPKGVDHDDLNREITRKIVVNLPGKVTQVIVQKAVFTRDAEVDEVTGEINYDEWKLVQNDLSRFEATQIAGYTPSLSLIEAATPTVNSKYDDVQIDYVPVTVKNDPEKSHESQNDSKFDDIPTEPEDRIEEETESNETTQPTESPINASTDSNEQGNGDVLPDKDLFLAPLGKATEPERTAKSKKKKTSAHRAGLHGESAPKQVAPAKIKAAQAETSVVSTVENRTKTTTAQIKPISKSTLPATGNQSGNLSWLGFLLSSLGLSGLWINRKKKIK